MVPAGVNRRLLPLKMSYFCIFGSIAPVIGFLPTLAKQLGFSISTYGSTTMFVSLIAMLSVPLFGIIAEHFRVKKKLFFTVVLLNGLSIVAIMFLPRLPSEAIAELKCDKELSLIFYNDNFQQELRNETKGKLSDQLVTCKLACRDSELYDSLAHQSKNASDLRKHETRPKHVPTENHSDDRHNEFVVTLDLNDSNQTRGSYVFRILWARIDGEETPQSITCPKTSSARCHVDCANAFVTDLATAKTYRGNVVCLYQFWFFFVVSLTFGISSVTSTMELSPITLDLLEDKTEDFGRQRLWGSIGWGTFSIFIAWLMDLFSAGKKEKNYSPLVYSSVVLTLCNLIVCTKIKIVEVKKTTATKTTRNRLQSVFGLITERYVIIFLVWSIVTTFFHTIITHFLFWYMEDLVVENHDQKQWKWIKTLQGLAQGIQCFAGEIPFFFCSGWIITKINHVNCMAVSLGAVAVRFFLYTVISNPVWVLLIELLNGISHSLAFTVKMSYAKIISPPDTTFTVIGLLTVFDMIGDSLGSLLGGYLFGTYGGLWTFRLFAFSSAIMCFLNVLSNCSGWTKNFEKCDFTAVPTENIDKSKSVMDPN